MKKSLKTIPTLILILLIAGLFFVFQNDPDEARADWWNDSWQYRQSIQVTNNASEEINVYISVTLNTDIASTSMQTDCGDFRFTKESGEVLPYYISSGCRTTNNVIHINFATFAAGEETIYFYYGNPSAENGFQASDFATEASNYTIGAVGSEEVGPGPVGYWSFDEGYGATVYDGSLGGNNGTVTPGGGSYTAKSVILDIADNWGGVRITLRSVDFWYDGSKISLADMTDFTAYETSFYGSFYAKNIFDTSRSKIGPYTSTEWLASNGSITNQRLIVVFDSSQTFDGIRINNSHTSGTFTNRGAKNVVINYSTDSITDTTYNATISNAIEIFDGQFDEHVAADVEDEQTLTLIGDTSTMWQSEDQCVAGKCLWFDGTDDSVTMNNFQFSTLNQFSISQFLNFQTLATGSPILAQWGNSQNAALVKLDDTNSDELKVCIADALTDDCTNYAVTTNADISANSWYNLQVVYDGAGSGNSGKLKLYLNGFEKTLSFTGTIPAAIPESTEGLEIGGDADLGAYSRCRIDEVKVYPYARTADQVKQDYSAGLAGVETPHGASVAFGGSSDKWMSEGLVGYWKMDETATTSGAIDSSGNGNVGTYEGTASTTGGKYGRGGIFASSSSDYVNVADADSLNPASQVTLSAWVKSNAEGGYIIAKDPPDSGGAAQVRTEIEKTETANQTGVMEKIKNYAKNHNNILIIIAFFYLSIFSLGIYKLKRKAISGNIIIGAMALSGAAALIYQVAATQALTYFFNSSSYSVSTAIVSFLLGLALGSFIISKYLSKIKHPIRLLIVMQILVGVYALFVLPQYYRVASILSFFYEFAPDSATVILAIKLFVGIIFLLFPTIMLGASFPLASSLIIKNIKTAGSDVGRLYSWDLIGAVLGALISGFVLLPKFGLTISFAFGAAINIFAALLLCDIQKRKMAIALLGIAFFVPLSVFGTKSQNLISQPSASGIVEVDPVLDEDVLFKKESAFGEILVSNKNNRPALSISKIIQCNTDYPPLLKNLNEVLKDLPAKGRALDVGLGCGYSASAISSSTKIDKLDIVEINPVLTDTLKYFGNDTLLNNDKVDLNNDDVMHYLARTQNTYDFVNVELNMPSLTQVSPFYSKEYFQLLKQKVSQDGTIRLWVCCGNYEYLKTIYRTLNQVYENVIIKTDMDTREDKDYYFNSEFIIGNGAKSFEQNEAEKKLQKRIEKDKDFRISTLDNQLIGQIWYDWSQKNYKDYFVQPEKVMESEKPIIADSYLFPLDVKPGDTMDAGARIIDEKGIDSVKISFPHEKGEDWVNLELSEGTIYDGLWKGEWPVHDTIDTTYFSRLVVENKEKVTEEKVIEWSDLLIACDGPGIIGPYTADVGSTVSVFVDMMGMCGTISIADNTGGSYAIIPATDTDLDCNGDVCSSDTSFTRDIKCEAAGIYNIKATNFGFDESAITTVTCNAVGKSDVPYALSTVNGGQFLIKSDDTDYTVDAVTDINDGEWHHLLGTYDGSAMRLYVDGELEDTNTAFSGDLPVVAGDLHIGADYEEDPGNFLDGQIDEARIYNRALSPDEVRKLYEWAPGPIMHMKMDEKSGDTAYDTSGYGNDGALTGGASWTRGKYGSGLLFDGVDGYLDIGDTAESVNTISFWLKPDSTTEDIIDLDGGTHTIEATAGTLSASGFSSPTIYVNGMESSSIDTDWNFITVKSSTAFTAGDMDIGRVSSSYLAGIIDDVRVYNYARTEKQILEDMSGGGRGNKSAILHLNFDEGYGETAHNSSLLRRGSGGQANDGTLYVGSAGTQTVTSSMWEKSGRFRGGVELDGTDDYIAVPDWICGVDQLEDVDGNLYDTVQIGTQCWMAENLMVSKNADGTAVNGTGDVDTTPPVAYNDVNWEETEGYLYNWQDAMNGSTIAGAQGICPDGWHLPSDDEWVDLEVYICEQEENGNCEATFSGTTGYRGTNEGTELKAVTNVNGVATDPNGDDGYGFAAFMAGYHSIFGAFSARGSGAICWSSSESVTDAWLRSLSSTEARVNRNADSKANGFSVRCVQD